MSEIPEPTESEKPEPTEIETPEEPTETGSTGTQESGALTVITPDQKSPFKDEPISLAVGILAASHSRSLGGEVAAGLLAGSFQQLSHEHRDTKQKLDNTRNLYESIREELSDYKTKTAVLQERIKSILRIGYLKKIFITIAPFLFAIGLDLRNDNIMLACILFGLGALLILFGWFPKEGSGEK